MIRFIALCLLLSATPAVAQVGNNSFASGETGLSPEFRGKVRYFGNHSGKVSTRLGAPRRPGNLCPKPSGSCPEPVGGSLQLELSFDGEIVKGSYRGTGGLPDGTLIGRRLGSNCHLYDTGDGSEWTGICDARGFSGVVKSVPNAGTQVEINFQSVGIRTIDYARIYEQWRQEKAWARRFRALEARAYGDGPLNDRLDALLELDSSRWLSDRYVPGSLGSLKKSKSTYYGTIQLDGGRSGWVRAHGVGGAVDCLEYWDQPGVCKPFVRPSAPPPPADSPNLEAAESGASSAEDLPARQ